MYIDDSKCMNCQSCVRSFPELFETYNNYGELAVKIKSGVSKIEVEEASVVCPNKAIIID